MKCPVCGYEGTVYDFIHIIGDFEAYINQSMVPVTLYACPKCKIIIMD